MHTAAAILKSRNQARKKLSEYTLSGIPNATASRKKEAYHRSCSIRSDIQADTLALIVHLLALDAGTIRRLVAALDV